MSEEMMVHKVKLSSGKEVLLRELRIKDQELATQAASTKVKDGGHTAALAVLVQKELLKTIIVQIDGKRPEKVALEAMDNLFSYREYMELLSVLSELTGGTEALGKPEMELVSFGGQ